jgi:hypothetical protein
MPTLANRRHEPGRVLEVEHGIHEVRAVVQESLRSSGAHGRSVKIASSSKNPRMACLPVLCDRLCDSLNVSSQAERVLVSSYEDLLRKVQLMGQSLFREELKPDIAFWVECGSEWGRGSGYRDRVAGRNIQWFSDAARQKLERELLALIEREWRGALANLESLFDTDE